MDAVEPGRPAIDGPTLSAAAATLLFAVVAGVLLGYLPEFGQFGGAIDALKNLMYVLTVPIFDIVRRVFARRKQVREHTLPAEGPNLLTIAFASALILFVIIEIVSWLMGFGVGGLCSLMAQSAQEINVGSCLMVGINIMSSVIVAPMMIALGFACGWIWQRLLTSGVVKTLLFFAVAIAILFALDFFILLQNAPAVAREMKDQMSQVGPLRQIGLQIVILVPSMLLGYGARRLWSMLVGAFG